MGESELKILVTSDNHLGFIESDPVRGEDSFETFEEILVHAVQRDADAVLLGGDLFHENKPSRNTIHKAIMLFRKHCLGDRPIAVEFVQNSSAQFRNQKTVNYADNNFNIKMPVFAIHGNHDDPTGFGNLSALDVLSGSGLINYFGRCDETERINIVPVLLKKGQTRLAIYGLGYVRDQQLHRLFLERKINYQRPLDGEDWVNIFVIHQNRVPHEKGNYIPEEFLEEWFDIIVWAHEHESIIGPMKSKKGFFVIQTGSTVQTSISQSEVGEKNACLLTVTGKEWKVEKITLATPRSLYFETLKLVGRQKPEDIIRTHINDILARHVGPKVPLVRVRIEVDACFAIRPNNFGIEYEKQVANPYTMIKVLRKRMHEEEEKYLRLDCGTTVEEILSDFIDESRLRIIPSNMFVDALKRYIEKDTRESMTECFDFVVRNAKERITEPVLNEEIIVQRLESEKKRLEREFERKYEIEVTECNKIDEMLYVDDSRAVSSKDAEDAQDTYDENMCSFLQKGREKRKAEELPSKKAKLHEEDIKNPEETAQEEECCSDIFLDFL